jgi:hypothetical protein
MSVLACFGMDGLLVEQMSYIGFECLDGNTAGPIDSDRPDHVLRRMMRDSSAR